MKLSLIAILLILVIVVHAQDRIIKNDGTVLQGKITEVNPTLYKVNKKDGSISFAKVEDIRDLQFNVGDSPPPPANTPATNSTGNNTSSATGVTAIPEPDFVNTPMWLDPKDNVLKPFERPSQIKTGSRMTGIYSAETLSYITGITSTVRFTTDNFPRIFVKVNPGVDPSNTVELYKFQLNRNTSSRELIRGKANAFGGASSTASASRLDLKKVGKELYEVLFINSMLAGEYAFLNLNWDAFCFTLEPGNIANGNGNTIPGIGSSIPPSTEQIKLDLIGYNIDGWMFQSSNTYSQFLQNSMKEEGGSLEYNISVVVIQPSSGKDRSKKMTIRVVYHKNKLGNWALYLAELG